MASTAATAQTYNDTNVLGDVLETGVTRNTGAFFAAVSANGVKLIRNQEFPMSATYALDAGAQGAISEETSLTAGTADFYAKSQEYNVIQISKKEIAVSHLREAASQQIDTSNINVGGMAPTASEFDRVAANAMQQLRADWEFGMIQGTYVARSAVGTTVAMGGLLDATVGITTNTVAGGSAALSKEIIDELLVKMADHGAPFANPVFVVKAKYAKAISEIYGYQPQSTTIGGVAIDTVLTDFGKFGVIWTNTAKANTILVADLAYMQPVVLPNQGQQILMREYQDGGSAKKGFIEGFVSVDFGAESYHGSITAVA